MLNPKFSAFNQVRQIKRFGSENEKIKTKQKALAKCVDLPAGRQAETKGFLACPTCHSRTVRHKLKKILKVTILVTFFVSLSERTYFESNRKKDFEGLLDKARG